MSDTELQRTPFGLVVHISRDGAVTTESKSQGLDEILGLDTSDERDPLRTWQQFVHPDDIDLTEEAIFHLLAGETWEGDVRVRTNSGEIRSLHLYAEAEKEDDEGVRVEAWGYDATETIALMNRLHQLEERMRLVIDHVSAFTWTTDLGGRITSIEGAALAAIDIDPHEVVGRDIEHHFDKGVPEVSPKSVTRRVLDGEVVTFQASWNDKGFNAIVEPLRDLEGTIIGTLGIAVLMRNSLERAEQLRQLRSDLQHARMDVTGVTGGEVISVANIVINPVLVAAWKNGEPLLLSPTEFRLLLEFVRNKNIALRRRELLERVWRHKHIAESRLVDMAVKRLRSKVEDDPGHPTLIRTVRGVGYRLEESEPGPELILRVTDEVIDVERSQ
jgi:DNA-binding winged helix-turn-helix (wHTH) protein/PAS domain-containing protein